jgi:hypothetical protein
MEAEEVSEMLHFCFKLMQLIIQEGVMTVPECDFVYYIQQEIGKMCLPSILLHGSSGGRFQG